MENARLRIFRAVARHLSFSMAAEELFLSQPAVTQQIKALEEEVGASLFDRSRGRVALTKHGAVLLTYAEKIKELVNEATQALAEAGGTQGGAFCIGASQTIAQYLLPGLIAAFLKEAPNVQISAISGNTDEILDALAEHRIQSALIEGPPLRNDVKVTPFLEDEMVLIVPPLHAWGGTTIQPNELATVPLLTREHGSGSRRVVELALRQAGIQLHDLKIAMTFDSTEALMSGVSAGLGVAFVSRLAARSSIRLRSVALAKVEGLSLKRSFAVAHSSGPEPRGSAGAFFRFVMDAGHSVGS